MAYYCDRCKKGKLNIMAVSHAKNRSHRRAKPNLHWYRIETNGIVRKMRLCVKCARIVKAETKEKAEEYKKRLTQRQEAIRVKEKEKREVKMKKKEVEQKARKVRSEAKRNPPSRIATEGKGKKEEAVPK